MPLGRILYRFGQGIRHLTRKPDRSVDAALGALLTPSQHALLERLGPADRAHHLAVHRTLVREGHSDPDLLLAGLLHDVGKADDRVRVTLFHRSAKVLIGRLSPGLLARIARRNDGWLTHGMYLALHHARLGAEMARDAGASERACWFIAHHDDGTIPWDSSLHALQEIDARE